MARINKTQGPAHREERVQVMKSTKSMKLLIWASFITGLANLALHVFELTK